MSCRSFESWLDDGRPAESAAAAEDHARACAACAARLEAMREIEDLLSSRFAAAPATFTDRVMAGLPPRPRVRVARPAADALGSDFPWWIRIFQEPLTAISLVAGAVLLAALPALTRAAADWTIRMEGMLEHGFLPGGVPAVPAAASLLVPGAVVFVALAAPQLVRAFASVAGDPTAADDF